MLQSYPFKEASGRDCLHLAINSGRVEPPSPIPEGEEVPHALLAQDPPRASSPGEHLETRAACPSGRIAPTGENSQMRGALLPARCTPAHEVFERYLLLGSFHYLRCLKRANPP